MHEAGPLVQTICPSFVWPSPVIYVERPHSHVFTPTKFSLSMLVSEENAFFECLPAIAVFGVSTIKVHHVCRALYRAMQMYIEREIACARGGYHLNRFVPFLCSL